MQHLMATKPELIFYANVKKKRLNIHYEEVLYKQ